MHMSGWSSDVWSSGLGSKAAGQSNEAVGRLGHHGLALMHRAHHMQLRQAGVCKFAIGQRTWQHTHHLATTRQRAIGDGAHQPDCRTAVDQPDTGIGQRLAEPMRRLALCRPSTNPAHPYPPQPPPTYTANHTTTYPPTHHT